MKMTLLQSDTRENGQQQQIQKQKEKSIIRVVEVEETDIANGNTLSNGNETTTEESIVTLTTPTNSSATSSLTSSPRGKSLAILPFAKKSFFSKLSPTSSSPKSLNSSLAAFKAKFRSKKAVALSASTSLTNLNDLLESQSLDLSRAFTPPPPSMTRKLANAEHLSKASSAYSPADSISSTTKPSSPYSLIDATKWNDGIVGLYNLGNTCFLSSVVQALSATSALTEYFLTTAFIRELNTKNPLGMQGKIALAYARTIRQMWSIPPLPIAAASPSSYTHLSPQLSSPLINVVDQSVKSPALNVPAYAPHDLKSTMSHFFELFEGSLQHDAHEYFSFLLDGLHEDLNRANQKQQNVRSDSNDRPDAVVASEHWNHYITSNQSVIVDLFTAQLKSTIKFSCGRESATFDAYTSLSLPLPIQTIRPFEITVHFADQKRFPIRYCLHLNPQQSVYDLKAAVSQLCGLPASSLLITEIYQHAVLGFLRDTSILNELREEDEIIVVELRLCVLPNLDSNGINASASSDTLKSTVSNSSNGSQSSTSTSSNHSADSTQDIISIGDKMDVLDTVNKWLPATILKIQLHAISSEEHHHLSIPRASPRSSLNVQSDCFNIVSQTGDEVDTSLDNSPLITSCTVQHERRSNPPSPSNGNNKNLVTPKKHPSIDIQMKFSPASTASPSNSTVTGGLNHSNLGLSDEQMSPTAIVPSPSHNHIIPTFHDEENIQMKFSPVSTASPSNPKILVKHLNLSMTESLSAVPSPSPRFTHKFLDSVPRQLAADTTVSFYVHYDGFHSKWDEWITYPSGRIAPYGTRASWSSLASHLRQAIDSTSPPSTSIIHLIHRRMDLIHKHSSQPYVPSLFATPMLMLIRYAASTADIYTQVWNNCSRFLTVATWPPISQLFEIPTKSVKEYSRLPPGHTGELFPPFVLKLTNRTGVACDRCDWSSMCLGCPLEFSSAPCKGWRNDTVFSIDWNLLFLQRFVDPMKLTQVEWHESVQIERSKPTNIINMADCIRLFTTPEPLIGDAKVYCSACKTRENAHKTLELWSIPRVFVIHLKRLTNDGKMATRIEFPLNALDVRTLLSSQALESLEPPADKSSSYLYDLFAVVNHLGTANGGHFTCSTLGIRGEHTGKWVLFDDATVSLIEEKDVINPNSYMLFYISRDLSLSTSSEYGHLSYLPDHIRARLLDELNAEQMKLLTKVDEVIPEDSCTTCGACIIS